jgi:hypothetical protein
MIGRRPAYISFEGENMQVNRQGKCFKMVKTRPAKICPVLSALDHGKNICILPMALMMSYFPKPALLHFE